MARVPSRVSRHLGRKPGQRAASAVAVYMGPAAHTPLHLDAACWRRPKIDPAVAVVPTEN